MKRLTNILSSFRLTTILLVLLAVSLAAATWVENICGTQVARDFVYHSPWLFLLLVLISINFFMYAGRHGLLTVQRMGLVLTHSAFVVIMAGAAVTHFFGDEGVIHLREGERTDPEDLPFELYLEDFVLERYPGSDSPSSFESFITVYEQDKEYSAHIYMNNVLDIQGYRLYQASFDPDEKGSILSYNRDVAGRNVTYAGYIMLFAGLILSLLSPNGRFRSLYRSLIVCLIFCPQMASASSYDRCWQEVERFVVDEAHADRFGHLPVQATDGRMMPVNTFSSEILRKLHKSDRIGGMDSDQFLLSVLMLPDVWAGIPLLSVKNEELASLYGLDMPYASYVQFFDADGKYKLQESLDSISRKNPAQRSGMEKDMIKLDERVNIFHLLAGRRLLHLFPLPDDPDMVWYAPGDDLSLFVGKDSMFVSRIFDWYIDELYIASSSGSWDKADEIVGMIGTYQHSKAAGVAVDDEKMKAEVLYNDLGIFRRCRTGYLVSGAVLLLLFIISLITGRRFTRLQNITMTVIVAFFAFHTAGIGMRWYIGGYAPWTNSYETMVYIAWATVLAGLIISRRNVSAFSLAVLFGGVILFVSGMNWMDPHITTLVPVLKSPWLMFHVAVIVAAYGFLGLSCMTGILNMTFMSSLNKISRPDVLTVRIRELSILNELSMWIGLVLLTIGTFLGAVWANESWGRYWGWDPKETWALITIIVYAVVTHIHLLDIRMKEWLFNFMSVLAFSSVLMTFLGVNHLLSGMHSYGHNEYATSLFVWIFSAFAILIVIGLFSFRSVRIYHKRKRSSHQTTSFQL